MSTPLPPAANEAACSCMMDTLSCAVDTNKADEEEDYGDMFGVICGEEEGKYCAGINRNTTSSQGSYGAWSMCNPTQQLSFILHKYSEAFPDTGCDFDGKAAPKTASSNTPDNCKTMLDQAGPEGTGTVTSSPNNQGSSSKGAASGLTIPQFSTGVFGLGLYVGAAALSGMALIMF